MKLSDMKKKVLGLIEELNLASPRLTDDPDISTKINDVINQIMMELVRMKKIPRYVETEVTEGDTLDLDGLSMLCGYDVYQIDKVAGVPFAYKAEGTVIKFLEGGTAEIELFVFPQQITAETADDYAFEIPPDLLAIMPYGVAADLLKSDASAEYGTVYANRYESMIQRLDPRWHMPGILIEGGVDI